MVEPQFNVEQLARSDQGTETLLMIANRMVARESRGRRPRQSVPRDEDVGHEQKDGKMPHGDTAQGERCNCKSHKKILGKVQHALRLVGTPEGVNCYVRVKSDLAHVFPS